MRVTEARDKFRQLVQKYFSKANVIFGRQSRVAKPDIPLVSITGGNVTRSTHPVVSSVDGYPVGSYQSSVALALDLFTHGRAVRDEGTGLTYYENTAVEDMLWFADFLDSNYCIEWCTENDLAIARDGPVQDMTNIINDTTYEYRSHMEILLYFTEIAVGHTAGLDEASVIYYDEVNPVYTETSTGGGTEALGADEAPHFTSAEINETQES